MFVPYLLTASDLKQRTRWAVGTLETAQELNWGLPGKHVRNAARQHLSCADPRHRPNT
jgi:hypothetical protein